MIAADEMGFLVINAALYTISNAYLALLKQRGKIHENYSRFT
jgi:hypothetical protein